MGRRRRRERGSMVPPELVASRVMEQRLSRLPGGIEQVYRTGRAGRWNRAAHALTAVGGVGAVLGRRSRVCSAASGLALLAGSLATRFAVFEAGMASAVDPQHVAAPQRERLKASAARSGHRERL